MEELFLYTFYVFLGLSASITLPVQFLLQDDLSVQPSAFEMIFAVASSTWCVKFLIGFLVDRIGNTALNYKIIVSSMLLVNAGGWLFLSSWSPWTKELSSIETVTVMLWVIFSSLCVCDVATDGRMIRLVHDETGDRIGRTQTIVWGCRSLGRIIGGITTTVLLQREGSSTGMFSPRGFIDGFVVAPFACMAFLWIAVRALPDPPKGFPRRSPRRSKRFGVIVREVWRVLTENKRLVVVMVSIALVPDSGSNMYLYLSESLQHRGLGFGTHVLGVISIVHSAACIVGACCYHTCFKFIKLRTLFYGTIVIQAILSLSQLVLLFGLYHKIGVSAKFFVLSDDVIGAIVEELLFLPLMILMATMIPRGFESSVYSTLTSLSNVCSMFSSFISAGLTVMFGITRDASGVINFDNLWVMALTCTFTGLVPLLFFRWLPKRIKRSEVDVEEGIQLVSEFRADEPTNYIGGRYAQALAQAQPQEMDSASV